MGRRKKMRYCQEFSGYNLFKPAGIPLPQVQTVEIALDELEAMHLCDLQGYDQTQAAEKMGISRGTLQRLVYAARGKLVDVVIHGKALAIQDADHILTRNDQLGHRRGNQGPGLRKRRRHRGFS